MYVGGNRRWVALLIFRLQGRYIREPLWIGAGRSGLLVEVDPYERRVTFSLVEIYERVGKSVISVRERAQRAEQMNFMALQSRRNVTDSYLNDNKGFCSWAIVVSPLFVFYSSLNDNVFTAVKKGCKVLNKVCERGTICQWKVHEGSASFVKNRV